MERSSIWVSGMQRADFVRRSRQRDVDLGERARFFLRAKVCRARFERGGHGVADFIEQFSDDRLFFFAERFHLLAPGRDAAAASEIFYARRLERLLVGRCFDFAQGFVAQLFEWMAHVSENR